MDQCISKYGKWIFCDVSLGLIQISCTVNFCVKWFIQCDWICALMCVCVAQCLSEYGKWIFVVVVNLVSRFCLNILYCKLLCEMIYFWHGCNTRPVIVPYLTLPFLGSFLLCSLLSFILALLVTTLYEMLFQTSDSFYNISTYILAMNWL